MAQEIDVDPDGGASFRSLIREAPPVPWFRLMRFGVELLQVGEWPELRRRATMLEDLGFDFVWVADHFTGMPGRPWFEGWSTLAAIAEATSRIRLGPLVSSIVLRSPQMLALQAVTVDHISGGRLELAIGSGAQRDHAPLGLPVWSPEERQARLEEYGVLVDRLLREAVVDHDGPNYAAGGAEMRRRPVQTPRPPLILGGESRASIGLIAWIADGWSCMSGQPQARDLPALSFEAGVERAREQSDRLTAGCLAAGRDPGSVRRGVLAWRLGFDPLDSAEEFERFVDAYAAAGFDEFNVGWLAPTAGATDSVLERIAADVLPRLRRRSDRYRRT